MNTKKKAINVFFIAYYFPPESSSGSFRPLYFANHLKRMGCEVSVLTSKVKCYLDEQPTDYALLDTLNSDIKIIRTRVVRPRESLISLKNKLFQFSSKRCSGNGLENPTAAGDGQKSTFQGIKDFITDLLAIPDPHIGWLPSAIWTGRKIVISQEIDVIWATGSPWTCFLVGSILKKLTGKPLVLDYRDPWGANPKVRLKNKYIAAWELRIEQYAVASADLITANTKELRDDFLIRFPFLTRNKVVTMPNGFEDFVKQLPTCENRALTLTHAGAVYFSRNPINLLLAIKELLNDGVIPPGKIKVKFVGGISIDDPGIDALLGSPELENVVEIYPRMVLDKAIEHQLASDVLFLLQPGFPLQIPRKLYEYLSLCKPILAITDENGATGRIINENRFGVVVPDTKNDIKRALKRLWLQWEEGNLPQPPSQNSELFLNSNISRILYDHLVRLSRRGAENVSS